MNSSSKGLRKVADITTLQRGFKKVSEKECLKKEVERGARQRDLVKEGAPRYWLAFGFAAIAIVLLIDALHES